MFIPRQQPNSNSSFWPPQQIKIGLTFPFWADTQLDYSWVEMIWVFLTRCDNHATITISSSTA